jgi:hypothetical protein
MPYGTTENLYTRAPAETPWGRVSPTRQRPDPCTDDCTPRCPACGGLECLCRPRFFPGQLLTDDDLNRLQRYVIDKNRLRNRYLHGWGVACGLEVACDPCDPGHVVVRTGYALSPCGDDIIVCTDQSVDVCALIEQCEPREPVCDGPYSVPPRDCKGGVKEWTLAVCYDERPVRGVTAQLGAGDTTHGRCKCGGSGGCGCGGGTSGGCGCGAGRANGKSGAGGCGCGTAHSHAPGNGRKDYKPQCEPTQICESYRFMAYPAPSPVVAAPLDDFQKYPGGLPGNLLWAWLYANRRHLGPLIERVLCCVTRAMKMRAAIREGKKPTTRLAIDAYTGYAAALADFARDFAVHRCGFVSQVNIQYDQAKVWERQVAGTPVLTAANTAELNTRLLRLDATWLDILAECMCSALLPGCPEPAATNCVPLAVITLRDGDCRIADICNWRDRKLLISWPTISYWLSWLPWQNLRRWISNLCCDPERDRTAYSILMLIMGIVINGLQRSAAESAAAQAAAMPRRKRARAPGRVEKALEADNLLGHMVKDFDRLRAEGGASAVHPPWAALIARLSDASAFEPLVGGQAAAAPKAADLTKKVDGLRRRVEAQQRQIDALKAKK